MRSQQDVLSPWASDDIILGISAFYHDSSVAFVSGSGDILYASLEERFSGEKHDARFPKMALENGLKQCQLSLSQVKALYFYEKPILRLFLMLRAIAIFYPSSFLYFYNSLKTFFGQYQDMFSYLSKNGFTGKIYYLDHHTSHAALFFLSNYENAGILVADAVGDNATLSVYRGAGNHLDCLEEQYFPHSIGLLYSLFTVFLGFKAMEGEYKVMGLASYGEPIYLDQIKRIAHIDPNTFALTLDTSYFNFVSLSQPFKQKFLNTFGKVRTKKDNIEKKHQDIAASIQAFTEEYLLSYAQFVKNKYGFTHLVFAGGVAMNCKFNGLLHESGLFEDTFVYSNPGDGGSSLGAALYGVFAHGKVPRRAYEPEEMAYLGYENDWSLDEVKDYIRSNGYMWREEGVEENGWIEDMAAILYEEDIVAIFQGKAEYGPRALGNRSILASPFEASMKDKLNVIKWREYFRPFAPMVLDEEQSDFFSGKPHSPFMMYLHDVVSSRIPAITHVDNTARIQTVTLDQNPLIYRILKVWERKTGVGVVLNTSFNLGGEVMVNDIKDALSTFRRSNITALYLLVDDRILIVKK